MDNLHFSSLSVHQESIDFEKTRQWDSLLDLTYAVWRVCDMAVESEFLRTRIKQNAADILSLYATVQSTNTQITKITDQVNSQIALLSLAQKISNAKEINFVILKNEYRKFNSILTYTITASHNEEKRVEPVLEKKQPISNSKEEYETKQYTIPTKQESVIKNNKIEKPQHQTLNDRQIKIVQFFNKSKESKIKLKDIAQFFPDLTDRTIRNDLRDLCNKKIINRSEGFGQASYYFMVK